MRRFAERTREHDASEGPAVPGGNVGTRNMASWLKKIGSGTLSETNIAAENRPGPKRKF